MLYLPPMWAHDGIAEGECMTYSVGFRSPKQDELARELFLRLSDAPDECPKDVVYKDPKQTAVAHPGEIPAALLDFARQALEKALAGPLASGRITLDNGKIGISGNVLFALNSDQLQPEGRQVLKGLAQPSGYTEPLLHAWRLKVKAA